MYWFNIWWTGDPEIEEVELFVKWPGEKKFQLYWNSLSILDCDKYANFGDWFYTVGSFSYYWEVTYKNGSIQKLDVTNVSVYKGDNYVRDVSESYTAGTRTDEYPYSYFYWEKKYSNKARSFSLGAHAAAGKIKKYKSNNKKVTVNSKGKVTIAKKFVGRAIISIYLPATKNFKASIDYVWICVDPKTPTPKVSSPKKGQMKVSWKKDTNVSGYVIHYATDKKMWNEKRITIKKNSVSNMIVKGLKSGKKYYVEMYSYKVVDKLWYDLYSDYSKTKSIKVK